MGNGITQALAQKVDAQSSTALHVVGEIAFQDGKFYKYTQADDTIAINSVLKYDIAASATGAKVTPTAAAGDSCAGVAEIAVTDEYYFWMTIYGLATALVADGIAVDDPLAASGTAGTFLKAIEVDTGGDYRFVAGNAMVANSSGGAAARAVMLRFL